MAREGCDLSLQIVARFGRALGAEQSCGACDPVMPDHDRFAGACELEPVLTGLGDCEVERDARRVGKSFERLDQLFSAKHGGGLRGRFETGKFHLRRRYLAQDRMELELAQQFGRGALVHPAPGEFVRLDADGSVGVDTDQSARQVHRRAMLAEQARDFFRPANPALLDTVQVLVDFFHSAELLNQRRGRLLADAGHTFDVVDRVAGESLDIDQQRPARRRSAP